MQGDGFGRAPGLPAECAREKTDLANLLPFLANLWRGPRARGAALIHEMRDNSSTRTNEHRHCMMPTHVMATALAVPECGVAEVWLYG